MCYIILATVELGERDLGNLKIMPKDTPIS